MSRTIPKLTPAEKSEFVSTLRLLLTAGKNGGAVRFKHEGRSLKGVDCVGTPVWGYAQLGMACYVRDLDRYSKTPDGHTLERMIREHLGEPLKKHQWQPGDIALLRWIGKGGANISHVAILTRYRFDETGKTFGLLHALRENKKVIEHVLDSVWRRRIVEVYRT